ncbi:MAG TPA: TerC family protein [Candidatus Acidoferrales bacterium]|jgi:YjbE family integral membrane protein|nr:TerC family protein [Candidatus Acidoferrales bacterium]
MHFLLSGLSIVLIDLLLAGDNALVIAMAVRSLPPRERRIGIAGGAAAAVLLRIGLTVVAARILQIEYVKLAGGLLILWIAHRVLVDASAKPDSVPAPHRFWQAIWYIVVADLTMSTDNILAIAGASNGNFWLIAFGLALSIPFVVMSSNLLSKVMDRYPATIYLGAGLLGKVGGDMIMTDGFITRSLAPSEAVRYGVEAALAIAYVLVGRRMCSR